MNSNFNVLELFTGETIGQRANEMKKVFDPVLSSLEKNSTRPRKQKPRTRTAAESTSTPKKKDGRVITSAPKASKKKDLRGEGSQGRRKEALQIIEVWRAQSEHHEEGLQRISKGLS